MKSSARSLVVLLAVTVALAALLALEAVRATRSHRVTAERALRDYASVAAWEFASASRDLLDRQVAERFGRVVGNPAASPYDSLPPPSVLAPEASALLPCPSAPSSPTLFAVDLRNGLLVTSGAQLSSPTRAWVRDAILARVSGSGLPSPGTGGVVWGEGAGHGSVLIFGVKWVRYSGYAPHEAPLAAYGVVTCPDALTSLFTDVLRNHPLLPAAVTGGIENSRLVSLQVSTPGGYPLFRSGLTSEVAYAGDPAALAGWIVVRASLPSEVAPRLVLTTPGSRLPLLLGLLALTIVLAVIALRQLRREQELTRLRGDFTSSVSHELRTPLTQIILFTETLELGRAGNKDEQRQALGIIGQEARRLAVLVENVLQFSRAERHLTRLRTEPTALAPLMREILERFAPLAGLSAMRIRTELDEGLVAPVDPEALHQITINLLDNAIKYGNREGRITLRTRLVSGSARIEVEDRGPGIAPADRLRIWEPFVRIAEESSVPGSGIGLAVVRELVTCHGGKAWVEDGSSGGARFVVELPGACRIETTTEPPIRARATEV